MHDLTPAQAALVIIGYALAGVRLLTASRPLWGTSAPARWSTVILPAVLVGLGAVPSALEGAASWLDVATAIITAVGAGFAASRGPGPKDPPGGTLGRDGTLIPPGPLTEGPPLSVRPPGGMDAEIGSLREGKWWHPGWRLALVLVIAGCSRDVQPCSTEDYATGPLALHNTICATKRQAKFPNFPDPKCDATPACAALVAECDRWVKERCK